MQLLLIRHAVAVPRGTEGWIDDERPLTAEGRREFRVAAKGLASLVQAPSLILTSPLPRARHTALIAARAWKAAPPRNFAPLARNSVRPVVARILKSPSRSLVACVGHEPYMSLLLAALLGGSDADPLTFRKGGAALLDAKKDRPKGKDVRWRLVWFMPPELLAAHAAASSTRRRSTGTATRSAARAKTPRAGKRSRAGRRPK